MSEIIERVAKALYDVSGHGEDFYYFAEWETPARAAIEAMREPSLAMIAAGAEDILLDTEKARRVWQAMIREALR